MNIPILALLINKLNLKMRSRTNSSNSLEDFVSIKKINNLNNSVNIENSHNLLSPNREKKIIFQTEISQNDDNLENIYKSYSQINIKEEVFKYRNVNLDFRNINIDKPKKDLIISRFALYFRDNYFLNNVFKDDIQRYFYSYISENDYKNISRFDYPIKVRNNYNEFYLRQFVKPNLKFFKNNNFYKITHDYINLFLKMRIKSSSVLVNI